MHLCRETKEPKSRAIYQTGRQEFLLLLRYDQSATRDDTYIVAIFASLGRSLAKVETGAMREPDRARGVCEKTRIESEFSTSEIMDAARRN